MTSRMETLGKQVECYENSADAGKHAAVGVCSYQEAVKLGLK